MNGYMKSFMSKIRSSETYLKNGNGNFIHSCHTHCEGNTDLWNKFAVDGVTMQQAVSKWWNSSDDSAADDNNYSPCHYNENGIPRECNNSCGAVNYNNFFTSIIE